MLSKKVKATLRWLRRHYPATMPVVVKQAPGLDCHGISSRDSETVQSDSLLEEWAHVLRSECPVKCADPHDQIFWGIMAAITKDYRGDTDEWHEVDG
jgi:hypothetical protein